MKTLRTQNDTYVDQSLVSVNTDLEAQFSQDVKILLIVLIALLIILTVFGNIIVMLAFLVDKRLRTQSNFFLLNLAICDFLIGAVAIPLYLPYMLTGKWMLGRFLCKLWLIVDYTMCVASAFNVVLISCDRFLCVTKAVLYRSLQNKHGQTVLKITAVWTMSFLLYGPALLLWESVFGDYGPDNICVAGFYYTWYFLLGASSVDFALPLISISFFNISIYWNIKKRSRKRQQTSNPQPSGGKESSARPYIIATSVLLSSSKLHKKEELKLSLQKTVKIRLPPQKHSNGRISFSSSQTDGKFVNDVHIIKLSKDKKVARSLAILVWVFAFCWAPYTFLMSIRATCQGYCVNSYWYDITFWLLWINSAINPFLYPLCHKSFRKAFIKLFERMCLKKDFI